MIRTLLLLALLPLVAGRADALPLPFEGGPGLKAPPAAIAVPADSPPLVTLGLFARDVELRPSGRPALGAAWALSHPPLPARAPAAAPVGLPLPGAMPHFLAALAGLALVARRRRRAGALAGRRGAT
jgi:hypothetical protein